jgi:hypothetical protein
MSAKGFGGLFLGFVVLLVLVYYMIPKPGKKALVQEQIALNDVSSWRIRMEISQNGMLVVNRTHAAVCPDKEHIVERAAGAFAEYLRLGDDIYYRKNNMKWVKGKPGPDLFVPVPSPRPCLTNPGEPSSQPAGGTEEMRLALEGDIQDGKIDKGEVQQSKQGPCQEWTITRFTERNQLGSYTTCLGPTDYLPRYIKSANERFAMYFEWNPALSIEPPDVNTPESRTPMMP